MLTVGFTFAVPSWSLPKDFSNTLYADCEGLSQ